MAHKKGLGSSKNGRDSNAKRLGVKVFTFKPKRGFKKTRGHRSELSRITISSIGAAKKPRAPRKKAEPAAAKKQPAAAKKEENGGA